MTRRLICCLLLSVTLHLLLWLPGFAPPSSTSGQLMRAGGGRIEAQLRVLDPQQRAAVQAYIPEPVPQAMLPDTASQDSVGMPVTEPIAVTPSSPSLLPVLPASLPRGFDRDDYLSGSELDMRPTPVGPIIIDLQNPEGMNKDKGQVVLVMYVSAEGMVDHVDIDSADVSSDVAESLAGIFGSARMRPGIKADQPVKAKIKILVEFEIR